VHKQQYKSLSSRSIELPGVIGAATTAIKLPVILVAGRGRSIAAPFLVGGRGAPTARAVAHPVLDGDADHMDDALEGVAGDPGPERHGRVLVAAEHEHDRGDGDEGEVPEQVERHDGAGVGPVRLPLLEVLGRGPTQEIYSREELTPTGGNTAVEPSPSRIYEHAHLRRPFNPLGQPQTYGYCARTYQKDRLEPQQATEVSHLGRVVIALCRVRYAGLTLSVNSIDPL